MFVPGQPALPAQNQDHPSLYLEVPADSDALQLVDIGALELWLTSDKSGFTFLRINFCHPISSPFGGVLDHIASPTMNPLFGACLITSANAAFTSSRSCRRSTHTHTSRETRDASGFHSRPIVPVDSVPIVDFVEALALRCRCSYGVHVASSLLA
eukprot:3287362-Amphidinium_carterae.2